MRLNWGHKIDICVYFICCTDISSAYIYLLSIFTPPSMYMNVFGIAPDPKSKYLRGINTNFVRLVFTHIIIHVALGLSLRPAPKMPSMSHNALSRGEAMLHFSEVDSYLFLFPFSLVMDTKALFSTVWSRISWYKVCVLAVSFKGTLSSF